MASYRENVVVRRGTPILDPYSQEVTGTDWSNPSDTPVVTLAPAEPRPGGEVVQNDRNAVTDGWTVYLPIATDVTSVDRVKVRGIDYDVMGVPGEWRGSPKGLVVQLKKVNG